MTPKAPFTFGSLFTGIGGLDLGLERAGMTCRWQVEIDPFCTKVLEKHWPEVRRYGDIRELDGSELERVDLIAGGFPCQDVSLCGLRRGIGEGTRSGLYADMVRLIRVLRPSYVLVENVPGLLSPVGPGEPAPIARVLGDLASLGFDAEWQSIPAAAVGAPHIRDRVWIFAYARSEHGRTEGRDEDRARCVGVFPQRDDRNPTEWREDRQLVEMVPGIHPRVATDWWWSQSRMDRTANGIPFQMERNQAFGNAVCPQVAQWIGEQILRATA